MDVVRHGRLTIVTGSLGWKRVAFHGDEPRRLYALHFRAVHRPDALIAEDGNPQRRGLGLWSLRACAVIVWRSVLDEGNQLLPDGENRVIAVEVFWIPLNHHRRRDGVEEGVAGLVREDVPCVGALPERPLLVRGEHRGGGGDDRAS